MHSRLTGRRGVGAAGADKVANSLRACATSLQRSTASVKVRQRVETVEGGWSG